MHELQLWHEVQPALRVLFTRRPLNLPTVRSSSGSASSIEPDGWEGSFARSTSLRLERNSASFHARIISRCDGVVLLFN
jgi:hypothetical protein